MKFGINIDHIATLRNARNEGHPCPIEISKTIATISGVTNITCHLREDERHIRAEDVYRLRDEVCNVYDIPLNMEISIDTSMVKVIQDNKPEYLTIVPEKREELTTESGLNLYRDQESIQEFFDEIRKISPKTKICLFVEPVTSEIDLAKNMNISHIEIHVGHYASSGNDNVLNNIHKSILYAKEQGLEVHLGHGITLNNLRNLMYLGDTRLPIDGISVGHFLIAESISFGIRDVVNNFISRMRRLEGLH